MFFAPFDIEHPDYKEIKLSSPSSGIKTSNMLHDDPEKARQAAEIAELISLRRQFLIRVFDEVVVEDPIEEPKMNQSIAPENIFQLAKALSLPNDDQLRRHYVRNLFRSGRPAEAKVVLNEVIDTDAMASILFSSAVRDLAVLTDPNFSEDGLKLVARLPVYVYEWCQASIQQFPKHSSCISSGSHGMSYIHDVVECAESIASEKCHDKDRISRLREAIAPS